jgi:hypothetical protein
MTMDRTPILNINPVDPFNPKPVVLKLRFGQPKEVEGKFGPQFMYGVEVNGQPHTLFASKALDTAIYETGAEQNDYVAVIRTGEGKDTRWQARLVDPSGNHIEGKSRNIRSAPSVSRGDAPAPRQDAPRPAPAPAPQVTQADRIAAFLLDESLYFAAMARARILVGSEHPVSIDLNAVSFVLYKMAKEHGVELDTRGNPVSDEAPEDEELPF